MVERYWEAGPGSVCPICYEIAHDRLGKCEERLAKCTICAGPHKLEEHKCGVKGCETGFGKICSHVTAVCANCKGAHQATSGKCPARQRVEKEARRKKSDKGKENINDIPMMQPDIDKENARLQLEMEERSPSSQLEIDKRSPRSEENVEPELGGKPIDKLDEENPDLDMENVDWPKRLGSALFFVPGDFECQNSEDPW